MSVSPPLSAQHQEELEARGHETKLCGPKGEAPPPTSQTRGVIVTIVGSVTSPAPKKTEADRRRTWVTGTTPLPLLRFKATLPNRSHFLFKGPDELHLVEPRWVGLGKWKWFICKLLKWIQKPPCQPLSSPAFHPEKNSACLQPLNTAKSSSIKEIKENHLGQRYFLEKQQALTPSRHPLRSALKTCHSSSPSRGFQMCAHTFNDAQTQLLCAHACSHESGRAFLCLLIYCTNNIKLGLVF